MGGTDQVIIKKVKKISGGGHHGGAWKVAYADFVTAMMAFFLLMWLLNATTEDQRKGIADYFDPSVPISPVSGGGKEVLNGSTIFSNELLTENDTGDGENASSGADKQTRDDEAAEELARQNELFEELQKELFEQINDKNISGLAKHIQTRVTPEGLVIELVDTDGSPLFELGSAKSSPTMDLLLRVVSDTLILVENEISIVGHTDALAYSNKQNYTNWDLSTDRAHAARRIMIKAGFPNPQISEVAGKADTDPLIEDAFAPQNRRISITILHS